MNAEGYKKEIVSMLADVTEIPHLRLIHAAAEVAYREEQAVRRIEDMERRGVLGNE